MTILSITKRFVTLMEMMIVMVLVATVVGALAWNFSGSLEKGKAFDTEQSMNKVRNILIVHLAEYPEDIDRVEQEWKSMVMASPMAPADSKTLIRDGWGKPFNVRLSGDSSDGEAEIIISSDAYNRYKKKR